MEHGRVTSVKYEDGVVYCDIQAFRKRANYEERPVLTPHSGFIQVPKEGQIVGIEKLKDGTRFVSEVIAKETASPDSMKEGELAIQLDNDTRLYFEEQANGDYNLYLEASGDLSIAAPGDVEIDAGGDVLIQGTKWSDHGHAYDWTDSGGSGVTDGPQ